MNPEEVLETHALIPGGTRYAAGGDICSYDGLSWPCSAVQMARENERLTRVVAALEIQLRMTQEANRATTRALLSVPEEDL